MKLEIPEGLLLKQRQERKATYDPKRAWNSSYTMVQGQYFVLTTLRICVRVHSEVTSGGMKFVLSPKRIKPLC
jgi:hypothetical protein